MHMLCLNLARNCLLFTINYWVICGITTSNFFNCNVSFSDAVQRSYLVIKIYALKNISKLSLNESSAKGTNKNTL